MFIQTTYDYNDLVGKQGLVEVNPQTNTFLRFKANTGNNIQVYGSYFNKDNVEYSGQLCGVNESDYSVGATFTEGLITIDTTGLQKLSIQGYASADVFSLYSERY